MTDQPTPDSKTELEAGGVTFIDFMNTVLAQMMESGDPSLGFGITEDNKTTYHFKLTLTDVIVDGKSVSKPLEMGVKPANNTKELN